MSKANHRHNRGFTLLEMTVALLLSSFIISGVFMFVQVNLDAVEVMAVSHKESARMDGLEAYVKECFVHNSDPQKLRLQGANHQIGTMPSDEITFLTRGGNAAFSTDQSGIYQIRLRLKDNRNGDTELGIERWHDTDQTLTGTEAPNFETTSPDTWIPLLSDVQGLNFQYYDLTQDQWIDEWNDLTRLPRLIRMQLWHNERQTQSTIFLPPINTQW